MALRDGLVIGLSPLEWGLIAGAALLLLYFVILTLSNSLVHAMEELRQIGWWILLLVVGFSVQVGLFVFMSRPISRNMTVVGGR